MSRRQIFRRIDKFHLTVWEYISASSKYAKKGESDSDADYDDKVSIYDTEFRVGPMLAGMFQPFVDMLNDGADTFRRYKYRSEIKDDFLQPIYGIGNILKALATIVWLPFSLILGTIRACLPHKKGDDIDPRMAKLGYRLGRHFLQWFTTIPRAAFTLVRGITQIVFALPTWFLKMPLRGIITSVQRKYSNKYLRKEDKKLSAHDIYYPFDQYERVNNPRRGLPRIRKINRAFFSVFDLSSVLNFPIFRSFAKHFYRHEFDISENQIIQSTQRGSRKHNPSSHIGYMLLGAFQPFVDMTKDVANLGYGYKSKRHVLWDLAQPLRGVGNIIKSLLTLIAVPLFLIGILIAAIIPWKPQNKPHKLRLLRNVFLNTLLWIPNALFTFVRGLTQIIFTVPAWFKMAIRGILSRNGYQRLKDDRGIQQLMNDSESTKKIVLTFNQDKKPEYIQNEDLYFTSIDNELERKARKAQTQGRALPQELEQLLAKQKPQPATQKFIVEDGSADKEYGTNAQAQEAAPAPLTSSSATSDASLAGPEKYRYLTFFRGWIDAPEEKLPNQDNGVTENSPLFGR